MPKHSFERYTDAVAHEKGRNMFDRRWPQRPGMPLLEILAGIAPAPIERPGTDADIVMFEAQLVANALLEQGASFDRRLLVNHPAAGTEIGAWSLNTSTENSQYRLTSEGQQNGTVNIVQLQPAILGATGDIYFSFHELNDNEIGVDLPPEPVMGLPSLGEGTAANEQIRYGLANLVLEHKLELPWV